MPPDSTLKLKVHVYNRICISEIILNFNNFNIIGTKLHLIFYMDNQNCLIDSYVYYKIKSSWLQSVCSLIIGI